MAHFTIKIEEMEYRPEDKSMHILAIDQFQSIISLEIKPAFPRQLAADLDFVSRHPNTRVIVDSAPSGTASAGPSGEDEPDGDPMDEGTMPRTGR
jgi:hypothetical protein